MNQTNFTNFISLYQTIALKAYKKYSTNRKIIHSYLLIFNAYKEVIHQYSNDGLNFNSTICNNSISNFRYLIKIEDWKDKDYLYLNLDWTTLNLSYFIAEIISKNIQQLPTTNIDRVCFAPYSDLLLCSQEDNDNIRNAHTISNSNNFINEEQYYSFDLSKHNHDIIHNTKIKPVSKKKASTQYIFCHYHDPILFADIEGKDNIKFNNMNHHFLQNYRIFYKIQAENIYHATKKNNNNNDVEEDLLQLTKKFYSKEPYKTIFKNYNVEKSINERIKIIKHIQQLSFEYSKTTLFDNYFRKQEFKKTLFFVIPFKKNSNILSSSFADLVWFDKNLLNSNEALFIHVLQNKNEPCLIFSGFDTKNMYKTLQKIEHLYLNHNHYFIEFLTSYICSAGNIYFTQNFFNNHTLKNKFEQYYNADITSRQQYSQEISNIYRNRHFPNYLIKLTKQEAEFLFPLSKEIIKNY
jgi:hypothetical protein